MEEQLKDDQSKGGNRIEGLTNSKPGSTMGSTSAAETTALKNEHQQQAPPPVQQTTEVLLDGVSYTKVKEGQGEVLFPAAQGVFYNPVQEFNRDMSVSILRLFATEYKRGKLGSCKQQKKEAYLKRIRDESSASNCIDSAAETSPEKPSASADPSNTSKPSNDSSPDGDHSPLTAPSSADQRLQEEAAGAGGDGTDCLPAAGVRHEDGLRVLEALAASGLRSVRYAKEVAGIKEIVTNDCSYQAVQCMKRNIDYNGVGHLVTASHADASSLLYSNRGGHCGGEQFDVIDLDPYGSPHLFLDGAVQAVSDGGLLLVTCTDMGVLCGNSPDACHSKYGATSLKSPACHEMALRITLQCLESHANRYGRYIVPLVSISADFYIRIAVRIYTSPATVKQSYTKVGLVYHCVGCGVLTPQRTGLVEVNGKSIRHKLPHGPAVGERCAHCGGRHQVAGPIWLDPIHDQGFLDRLISFIESQNPCNPAPLTTTRRMLGMLQMMKEEVPDAPLYYQFDRLCSVVGVMISKIKHFKSALLNAGYRVSISHCNKDSVKTDAPASFVWDVLRAMERETPSQRMRENKGAPGQVILSREIEAKVDFSPHEAAIPQSQKKRLLRFQTNPTKYWGPSSRATSRVLGGDTPHQDKQLRNQGRHAHKKHATPGDMSVDRDMSVDSEAAPEKEASCPRDDTVRFDKDRNNKRPKLDQN